MPQLAIAPTLPSPGPSPTRTVEAPDKQQQNKFSSHLDKAVARDHKQRQKDEDSGNNTVASSNKKTTSSAEKSDQAKEKNKSQEQEETQAAAPDNLLAESTDARTQITLLSQAKQSEAKQSTSLLPVENTAKPEVLAPLTLPSKRDEGVPTPQQAAIETSLPQAAGKQQNSLIEQLQRIIDQSDETGVVSITRTADKIPADPIRGNLQGVVLVTPPSSAPSQQLAAEQEATVAQLTGLGGGETTIPASVGKGQTSEGQQELATALKTGPQGLHPQQEMTAKKDADAKQEFQQSPQNHHPAQQAAGDSAPNGQANGLAGSPEQSNTFSQVAMTTANPVTQQADVTAKPLVLPSGTIVQENEVMNQLSQRLQLSSNNTDSRINLKLHPAELGSLKIDLTVKEGAIRANVISQSHHTAEILEKNMPKLKSILESQGYTVEHISIATESESVSDFNLFDQQLFSRNEYQPKATKGKQSDTPVFQLNEGVLAASQALATGVNVKI